jgi:KAP family P-loop domain
MVIGITGPWGSGKSSILNLLQEHIEKKHSDALVVRFDPWLVSGRDDLIMQFLRELIVKIKSHGHNVAALKKLGLSLADYGAQLAPIGNLVVPGAGSAAKASLSALKKALQEDESLSALRLKLVSQLEAASTPIVVLIDEIDRVEDAEVRNVAQLVRSVADFPGISYVLAYAQDRVVEALGGGERGRSYLEKIIQFQIPLPILFADEVARLIEAELSALEELRLPSNFRTNERYQRLAQLLTREVIQTPRDVQRLIATFHVLRSMLLGEVDWIDLLGFSALLVKSPATVEKIRADPEGFTDRRWSSPLFEEAENSPQKMFDRLVPKEEQRTGTKELLGFLFPFLSEDVEQSAAREHTDALSERASLLTVLRLNLLPGRFSREDVRRIFDIKAEEVEARLDELNQSGALAAFMDRINELYVDLYSTDRLKFWQGVGRFLAKPDCEWMTCYQPWGQTVRRFAAILEAAVRRSADIRSEAIVIFSTLRDNGEMELTPRWARNHMFAHGLFGCEKRDDYGWFFDAEKAKSMLVDMARRWRKDHLSGKFLPCHWSVDAAFVMIDTDAWTRACRSALDQVLEDDRALDGFTLLLFGGSFTTDQSSIKKLCSYESYIERARRRLQSVGADGTHETVGFALKKALGMYS